MLFLANLARVIPVNPIMLVDVTHHAAHSKSGDGEIDA